MRCATVIGPYRFEPGLSENDGERYAWDLALAVARAGSGRWQVQLLSSGTEARQELIEPGLCRRVLASGVGADDPAAAISDELPEAIGSADIVHLHRPATPAVAAALVLAVQQRVPVCLTGHTADGELSPQVRGGELADALVDPADYHPGVDTDFFVAPAAPPVPRGVLTAEPVEGIEAALPNGLKLELLADQDVRRRRRAYQHALVTVVATSNAGAALESLACGTPVICLERCDEEPDGVEFCSLPELRAKLDALACDPARAREIGRSGRRRVAREHSLRGCGGRILDLYERLAG